MLIPLGIISPAAGSVQSGNIDVSIPESGLFLATTVDDSQTARVGYAVLDPSANAVEGMSIYEFQERGVLVSETSAPLVRLLTSGLVYAEIGNEVSTGLALVNPGDTDSLIEWTTSSGESGNFILAPGEHLSRFLSQEPFELTAPRSAFRFKASAPVGAIAIRVTINNRSEPLMAAIPVAAPWESDALPRTIPHIRSGGGWLSEIILLNPTDRVMEGQVMLRRADRLRAAIEETYVLAAGSVFQIGVPDGSEYSITARYAQITPKAGSLVPSTFAIMSLENGPSYDPERITVTSTSVTADYAGRDFRTFFESREGSRSPGSVNTGVALANPSDKTVTVTVEVLTKNGTYSGVSTTFDLIPDDQKVFFFNLEDRIPGHFVGALRVSSDSDFAVTALRARINERRETLWTRIPMVERVSPLRKLFGSRGQSPEMPEGEAYLVRYIDDFVVCFQYRDDALRFQNVLRKRLGKFGLVPEPTKTKLVEFGRYAQRDVVRRGRKRPETIYFLGMTLYCTRNRKGNFRVGLRTEKSRLRRSLAHLRGVMRRMRHLPVREQVHNLNRVLRGHYAYYGIAGNLRALQHVARAVERYWRQMLSSRSRAGFVRWEVFNRIQLHFPLQRPKLALRYREFQSLAVL